MTALVLAQTQAGPAHDGRVDHLIRRFSSAGGGHAFDRLAIPAARAPNAVERHALESRYALLTAALIPIPVEALRLSVAVFRGTFDRYEDDDTAALELGLWTTTLAAHPAWAVEATIRHFLGGGGTGWNPTRGPTLAMFSRALTERVAPFKSELRRISRVLDAEIEPEVWTTDADRARVAGMLAAYRHDVAQLSADRMRQLADSG